MQFFESFLGPRSVLGVDIGTTSIKIAELEAAGAKNNLVNYAILETYDYLQRSNEALQTSNLKMADTSISSYLKIALGQSGFRSKKVVASVPAFSAFSTLLEVPAMSDSEIKKFVDLQAKQYVPMPLDAVTLDWMKVGEGRDQAGSPKSQILLVSIPNEQIEKYQNIFKGIDLKLISLEIEGMSLARSLSPAKKENALVIDMGSRSTSFSIVNGGYLKFSSQTDFAGGSLTQNIAQGLNVASRRAEDLKKQRGLSGFGGEHELSTIIGPLLDVIIYEVRRLISNYEINYQEKVQSIIVSGGGANLIGINDYFHDRLQLPVTKASPFDRLEYAPALEGIIKDTGPLMSVAIGLGLKAIKSK